MKKIILSCFLLLTTWNVNAQLDFKPIYKAGETVRFDKMTVLLRNLSEANQPIVAQLKKGESWIVPDELKGDAIGVYEVKGRKEEYKSFLRVEDESQLLVYDIEHSDYRGLDVFSLDGGMSAEFSVQKSLSNLTGGVSHTWHIGPGGGPKAVMASADFLEKSLNKTVALYDQYLGAEQSIETVIISTGMPSIPYLSASMKAPVLPIHFLVSANSVKEISSILKYSSDRGTPCYSTFGYDASMDSVGVGWIKLLDLPAVYADFIKRHNVKNVIVAGLGENGHGESFCRLVLNDQSSKKGYYKDGDVYVLYTQSGSEFDVQTLSSVIKDYSELTLDKGLFLADWESGVTDKQISNIISSVKKNTTSNAYSLVSFNDMMKMYDLANDLSLDFISNNREKINFKGVYFNEYLISQPLFEMSLGYVPLLYWQFVEPKHTVGRVTEGLKKNVENILGDINFKKANMIVNARIGKNEIAGILLQNDYSSVLSRKDNIEEVWDLSDGINSPCEEVAYQITSLLGVKRYKKRLAELRYLNISDLSRIAHKINGIDFVKY